MVETPTFEGTASNNEEANEDISEQAGNRDRLLRISSAAERLGVRRQSIYYRITAGHLPVIVRDGVRFVRLKDVDRIKIRSGGVADRA